MMTNHVSELNHVRQLISCISGTTDQRIPTLQSARKNGENKDYNNETSGFKCKNHRGGSVCAKLALKKRI